MVTGSAVQTMTYKSRAIPIRCFSPPLSSVHPDVDPRQDVFPLFARLPAAFPGGQIGQMNMLEDVEQLLVGSTSTFHFGVRVRTTLVGSLERLLNDPDISDVYQTLTDPADCRY